MDKDSSRLPIKNIRQAAQEAEAYIDGRRNGTIKSLATPWKKYNRVSMGGIEWMTIHTIAGLSGSGKTAILNQLETGLFDLNTDEDFHILSFNFEMLSRALVTRKVSKATKMTTQQLNSAIEGQELGDDDFKVVQESIRSFNDYNINYVDQPGSVDDIKSTIIAFVKQLLDNLKDKPTAVKPLKVLIMLDHTILVKGKRGQQEREMLFELYEMIKTLLKQLEAKHIWISAILLSQMNREIEKHERIGEPSAANFPKKMDIFGGDAAYQFSDVVMVSMNPEQMGLIAYGPQKFPVEGYLYWHFINLYYIMFNYC
jgi:replicative DNA helicase